MRIFHFCSQFLSIFQFGFAIFCVIVYFIIFCSGASQNLAGVSVRKRNDHPLKEYRCLLSLIFR